MAKFLVCKNTSYSYAVIVACLVSLLSCKATNYSDVKLIGGNPALVGQYPGAVQMLRVSSGEPIQMRPACTGSFISKTHLLTASHCVLGSGRPGEVRLSYAVGERLYLAYGPKAETTFNLRIKAIHVPAGTVAYLRKEGGFRIESIDRSYDVAIVELSEPAPAAVGVAKLSNHRVERGTPFRYGGYGCEIDGDIPTTAEVVPANVEDLGPYETRLKYSQAKVSALRGQAAEGPNYEKMTSRSGCKGDSGGPVYFDGRRAEPAAGLTEVIGVNSYIRKPGDVPGQEATEIGFKMVTPGTILGEWVRKVLGGYAPQMAGLSLPNCERTNSAYSAALCDSSQTLSCNLSTHRKITHFPNRLIQYRSCLSRSGSGYEDPLGLLKPFQFDAEGDPLVTDQRLDLRVYRANWPGPSYLCFVARRLTTDSNLESMKARFDQALIRIKNGEDEPLWGSIPFLQRISSSVTLRSIRYDAQPKSLLFETQFQEINGDKRVSVYRIGECGVNYGF